MMLRRFGARIDELADRATADCSAFEPPEQPPDERQAVAYLRDGAGPALSLYVEAQTREEVVHFSPDRHRALENAVTDWFELYAACYGVDASVDVTLREAAELLVDTRSVRDVARVVTGVCAR